MSPELVIFDCDGVLVDSEPIASRIFAEALEEIGMALGHDEVQAAFLGLSMSDCVGLLFRRFARPLPSGFLESLQRRTFEAFRRELRPVRGIVQALDRIRSPLAVASSGGHEKMRLTLGLTGLLPRFEGRMFSAEDVSRGKPHPDLFLHAARTLGALSERCGVVEDSPSGVRGAIAAKMRVFGYAAGGDGAPLAREGARVFHDMAELPDLLERAQ